MKKIIIKEKRINSKSVKKSYKPSEKIPESKVSAVESKPFVPPIVNQEQIEKERADNDDKNKIEALLFACGKYIDEQSISDLCSLDKRRVRKLLESLKQDYEHKDNALMIFQEGSSWKINVREKYLSIVRKIVTDTELNRSMMETLAVIAWKSPVLQSDIVKTRGNKCYDHIGELETQGFIAKEKKGRSYVLKTTEKFFSYFDIDQGNLKSVMEAVRIPELQQDEQQTLTEPVNADSSDKIKTIELLRKTESEDEKEFYKKFLNEIDTRIGTAAEKNAMLEQEIPRPALQQPGDIQPPLQPVQESPADTVTLEQPISADGQPTGQPATEEAKRKTLTKKQLEKKFKDELLRVREKMGK